MKGLAMAYDEKLPARIRKTLGRKKCITEKQMFGGVCFLLKGNICCGVHKESLVLRLCAEEVLLVVQVKIIVWLQ